MFKLKYLDSGHTADQPHGIWPTNDMPRYHQQTRRLEAYSMREPTAVQRNSSRSAVNPSDRIPGAVFMFQSMRLVIKIWQISNVFKCSSCMSRQSLSSDIRRTGSQFWTSHCGSGPAPNWQSDQDVTRRSLNWKTQKIPQEEKAFQKCSDRDLAKWAETLIDHDNRIFHKSTWFQENLPILSSTVASWRSSRRWISPHSTVMNREPKQDSANV